MHRRTIRNLLTSACAAAALLAPGAAAWAVTCPPPPSPDCQSDPNPLTCPLSPYAAAVFDNAGRSPSYYWRLGEDRLTATDWTLGVGTTLSVGTQVTRSQPGAIACDPDGSMTLSGATPDGIWESHLVADPDGVRAAAAGTEPFGMEIWVKPHVLDQNSRRIMGHELQDGGYFLAARSNQLTFSRYARHDLGTSWSTITMPRGLPLDRWSFIAATYGADRVMRLYVDGALVGQTPSNLELPADPPGQLGSYPDRGRLVIGASGRWWSASDPSSRMWLEWDGGLDEAAWYQDQLIPTADDIQRLWQIGTNGS